jgi:LysM repeat protein
MNSQNTLNGAPLEQQPKSKTNILIPVVAILGVHVILLGALLLQGCKDKPSNASVADNSIVTNLPSITFTNPPIIDATATAQPPAQPVVTAPPVTPPTQPLQPSTANTITPPPVTQPVTTTTTALPEASGVLEHKIEKGETFAIIAKKYGVSVDAIVKANPNLNPRRLQVGQIVKIPERSAASATTTSVKSETTSTKTATVSNVEGSVYVVKPGDTLTKIAKTHGVSIRELKSANKLQTDKISVGQKLKIPAKGQSPSVPEVKPAENINDNSLPKLPPANV